MYKPCKVKCYVHKNDVYDIFEKIKAFMIHGKYKAEKIYIENCVYHGN